MAPDQELNYLTTDPSLEPTPSPPLLPASLQACGPSGRVISSEPIPSVAEACRENIKRHAAWCQERGVPVAPVEVINVAAGDGSCQEAEFTVYER